MRNPDHRLDYFIQVPNGARASLPWAVALQPPIDGRPRLVGHSPTVDLQDFDEREGVPRTRITLTASSRTLAAAHGLSFVVDRALASALRPGDELCIGAGFDGGIGISILRRGQLVAAAGAVSSVPLGPSFNVGFAGDLARQAEEVFRTRDPQYELCERPVQVTIDGITRILHRARIVIGQYEVFVVHGADEGPECMAISRVGVCPDCAATLTAPLLEEEKNVSVRPFESAREWRDTALLFALEEARVRFEAGDVEEAYSSALRALSLDRDSQDAIALVEQIERRL